MSLLQSDINLTKQEQTAHRPAGGAGGISSHAWTFVQCDSRQARGVPLAQLRSDELAVLATWFLRIMSGFCFHHLLSASSKKQPRCGVLLLSLWPTTRWTVLSRPPSTVWIIFEWPTWPGWAQTCSNNMDRFRTWTEVVLVTGEHGEGFHAG